MKMLAHIYKFNLGSPGFLAEDGHNMSDWVSCILTE